MPWRHSSLAFLFKAGVTEIELLQQLGVHG